MDQDCFILKHSRLSPATVAVPPAHLLLPLPPLLIRIPTTQPPSPLPSGIDKSDADINIHLPYTVCTHCTPNSADSCGNNDDDDDHDDVQMLMHSAIIQLHCKLDRKIVTKGEGGRGGEELQ